MELILAIAALCQVDAGPHLLREVDKYQLTCQKKYIECYYGKTKSMSEDELKIEGKKFLYECVTERMIK